MREKIRKIINRLLHDKDEFHKDSALKAKVALRNYLFDHVIELDKQIVPEKVRYFWENKRTFLFRLFGKLFLGFVFVAGVAFAGWFFGFKITPPPPRFDRHMTLYVTETTDTNYIKARIANVHFILMYPPNLHKDWDAYKEAMHFKFETVGLPDSVAYHTRRMELKNGKQSPSQFWGKYQMGKSAREACGIGEISWEEFSTNPELQEAVFKIWIRILFRDMSSYIARYEGKFMAGHQVTASGIISMAHNVGEDKTAAFLQSGGSDVPMDGDGISTPKAPATRFLALGGYNLTSILN